MANFSQVMRFREIPVRCVCGLVPADVQHVGLTAEHQLVITWHCIDCKMEVYVLKDLADCWHECPKPAIATEMPASLSAALIDRADREFLQIMGVRFS